MSERRKLLYILLAFLAAYFLPIHWPRFQGAVFEALALVRWYAREHVLLCLIPALFIAGAISVFVSQASVLKYFGASARKVLAYGVASVSGSILAVCSCTVLPLFSGIYTRGAGLGPAITFLFVGPALAQTQRESDVGHEVAVRDRGRVPEQVNAASVSGDRQANHVDPDVPLGQNDTIDGHTVGAPGLAPEQNRHG